MAPSLLHLDCQELFAASCWNEKTSAAIQTMGIAITPEYAVPWEVIVAQTPAVAIMGEVFSLLQMINGSQGIGSYYCAVTPSGRIGCCPNGVTCYGNGAEDAVTDTKDAAEQS